MIFFFQLLLCFPFYQACIDHISENVLYKIRNSDFPKDRFYKLENSDEVHGDTGRTNESFFLWFLARHPTMHNTFMIHNFNRTDHVWEGFLQINDWNAGLSNCTNDHQWFQVFNLLGDETSTKNFTMCLISMRDMISKRCFLLYGNFGGHLPEVNCSTLAFNDTQKAPSNHNIFEFIRMSDIRMDLKAGCSKNKRDERRKKCKASRRQ